MGALRVSPLHHQQQEQTLEASFHLVNNIFYANRKRSSLDCEKRHYFLLCSVSRFSSPNLYPLTAMMRFSDFFLRECATETKPPLTHKKGITLWSLSYFWVMHYLRPKWPKEFQHKWNSCNGWESILGGAIGSKILMRRCRAGNNSWVAFGGVEQNARNGVFSTDCNAKTFKREAFVSHKRQRKRRDILNSLSGQLIWWLLLQLDTVYWDDIEKNSSKFLLKKAKCYYTILEFETFIWGRGSPSQAAKKICFMS